MAVNRASGLRRMIDAFFLEKGLTEESVAHAMEIEVLAEVLEQYFAKVDQRHLMEADGAVGVIFTFLRALPMPAQMMGFTMISEAIRRSRIREPVRSALAASFRAAGPGLADGALQQGITEAELLQARLRSQKQFTTLKNEIVSRAQRMLKGEEPIPADLQVPETVPNTEAVTPSEDKTMPTPPVIPVDPTWTPTFVAPGGPTMAAFGPLDLSATAPNPPPDPSDPVNTGGDPAVPTPTNPNVGGGSTPPPTDLTPRRDGPDGDRWRYFTFLKDDVLPLRKQEVLTLPGGQSEYRDGFAFVESHLGEDSKAGKEAREAFALLPWMTVEEYAALKPHLDVLHDVREPKSTVSQAAREIATEPVHKAIGLSSQWATKIRALARANAWFPTKIGKYLVLDGIDNAVDDSNREKIYQYGGSALLALGFLIVGAVFGKKKEHEQELEEDKEEAAHAAALAAAPPADPAHPVDPAHPAHSPAPLRRRVVKKKGSEPEEATWTSYVIEKSGWVLMAISLVVGIAELGAWLAPGFHLVSGQGYPWWFNPGVMNTALLGIWTAKFMVLINDTWDLPEMEDGHDDHGAEEVPESAKHKETKKGHGDKHSDGPSLDAVKFAIQERPYKAKTVVPGKRRPGILKLSIGATFLGTIVNIMWAVSGTVLPAQGLFIAGLYLLVCILDAGQHWNTSVQFAWMQKFLQDQIFTQVIKPIAGLMLTGIIMMMVFSPAAQFQVFENLHGYTDKLVGVKPVTTTVVPPVVVAPPEPNYCRARAAAEERSPGYCSRHSDEDWCVKCPL